MVSVLFVCLGNICRSPTAEGVFRRVCEQAGLADLVHIDSAGTAAWHVGKAPDARAQTAAGRRGIDLAGLRARQVDERDFARFDLILAMDASNYADLNAMRPIDSVAGLRHLLDYAPDQPVRDVPDPYYGGEDGFERVLDLIEVASAGLLSDLRSGGKLPAVR